MLDDETQRLLDRNRVAYSTAARDTAAHRCSCSSAPAARSGVRSRAWPPISCPGRPGRRRGPRRAARVSRGGTRSRLHPPIGRLPSCDWLVTCPHRAAQRLRRIADEACFLYFAGFTRHEDALRITERARRTPRQRRQLGGASTRLDDAGAPGISSVLLVRGRRGRAWRSNPTLMALSLNLRASHETVGFGPTSAR